MIGFLHCYQVHVKGFTWFKKYINKGIKKFYFCSFSEKGMHDPDNTMCISVVWFLIFISMPCWGKADWQSNKGSHNRPKGWVSFTDYLKRTKYNLLNQVPSMGHFYPVCHISSRRQEGTHLTCAVCILLRIILQAVLVSTEKQVKSHPSGSKSTCFKQA